jgi:CHAT domain-containing protein
MQTEHEPFPTDETLAAYIDGRLDEETRKRVVAHMAECLECFESVIAAREISRPHAMAAETNDTRFRRPQLLTLAAAAAIVLALGVVVARRYGRQESGVAALYAAAPAYRPMVGRLNGFEYHPLKPAVRGKEGDDEEQSPDTWRMLGVASGIEADAQQRPTVDNIHALGVSYLLAKHSDDAVSTLQRAVQKDAAEEDVVKAIGKTKNISLLTDLSAAYLDRAKKKGNPVDIPWALECASRAWSLGRTPEAAWNRALALEAMHYNDRALAAWQDYLTVDTGSKWVPEATEHIQALQKPRASMQWLRAREVLTAAIRKGERERIAEIVATYPGESRTMAESEVLPEWARATLAGDAQSAARAAAELVAIGAAFAETSGDTFFRDTAAYVLDANAPKRHSAALACRAITAANALYDARDVTAAEKKLDSVEALLPDNWVSLSETVQILRASIAYYKNDYTGADAIISSLIADKRFPMGHVALRARALWVRGSSRAARAMPLEAIADHEAALADYTKLRDTKQMAALLGRLPADYSLAGDSDGAWQRRIEAFGASRSSDSVDFVQLLVDTARAAVQESANHAAWEFLDAAVALCKDKNPVDFRVLRVRALLLRAELPEDAETSTAARDDRKEAIALASLIPSAEIRFFTTTSVDFLRAKFADGAVGEDIAALEEAVRYAREHQHHARLPELLVAKANAYEKRNDLVRARAAIGEAVSEIDQQRSAIGSGEARAAFNESKRSVYAKAIRLALDADNAEQAFGLVEKSRAYGLADELGATHAAGEAISVAEVAHRLPADVAVVEYSVLPDRLLIWLIRRERARFYALPLHEEDLATLTRTFVSSIRASDMALPGANRLYELTIVPWIADVGDADAVVFVPDSDLLDVPFAALSASAGAAPLVQRFRIMTAPSATFLVSGARDQTSVGEKPVVIASPGAGEGSGLENLNGASAEAREISAMYPRSMLLDGPAATKAEFASAARNAWLVHFAGHAVTNSRIPALSALVMRDASGKGAFLYAHEIAAMDLHDLKTVVLSACQTAKFARQSNDLSSLSRAFLAAGVSRVIGSAWPLDDVATTSLAVELHKRLRSGESPASAVRAVQLASIGHFRPRHWAAFIVNGDLSGL